MLDLEAFDDAAWNLPASDVGLLDMVFVVSDDHVHEFRFHGSDEAAE